MFEDDVSGGLDASPGAWKSFLEAWEEINCNFSIIKITNVNLYSVRFYNLSLLIPGLVPDSLKSLAADPDSTEKSD